MKSIDDLFWSSSLDDLTKGYIADESSDGYICLICGAHFEKGLIYQDEDRLYEAEKYVKVHINKEHGSVFSYLINLNKRFTGLSDHQTELLKLFYKGLNDKEITNELGGGSTATIRNHRFKLKEREKQSKVFLAIMKLLEENNENTDDIIIKDIVIHKGATMVDERYNITDAEREKVLKTYFDEANMLKKFPSKEKRKIVILQEFVKKFEMGKSYTEKEVNEILKTMYADFVTIRRYLIEYGFLDRNKDGSSYWVKF